MGGARGRGWRGAGQRRCRSESPSGGGPSGAAAGEPARLAEPRGREQVIAAGDPRPPELRRPSQRFPAQRQPSSSGLTEASCRLRTRFPGFPLPARASEAPGSRAASGAAAARGGAKLWTCPDRRALRRHHRLGARSRSGARPAAPGAPFCKLLQRLKLRVPAGRGLRRVHPPRGRRGRHVTTPAREGAGERGLRGPGGGQAAAHGGPGLQPSSPPRPGPAEAAAPPPPRGRIRSKLPELRAGPEAAASRCAALLGDPSHCHLALAPHP